jgi:hypothetical protein
MVEWLHRGAVEARNKFLAGPKRRRAILECLDFESGLSFEETCFLVPKRGHVRALQIWTVKRTKTGDGSLMLACARICSLNYEGDWRAMECRARRVAFGGSGRIMRTGNADRRTGWSAFARICRDKSAFPAGRVQRTGRDNDSDENPDRRTGWSAFVGISRHFLRGGVLANGFLFALAGFGSIYEMRILWRKCKEVRIGRFRTVFNGVPETEPNGKANRCPGVSAGRGFLRLPPPSAAWRNGENSPPRRRTPAFSRLLSAFTAFLWGGGSESALAEMQIKRHVWAESPIIS